MKIRLEEPKKEMGVMGEDSSQVVILEHRVGLGWRRVSGAEGESRFKVKWGTRAQIEVQCGGWSICDLKMGLIGWSKIRD